MCILLDDKDAGLIRSLDDLERVKPGHLDKLRDWLKRYKTSDGKRENNLASEIPRTASEAMTVIEETHGRWKAMCGKDGSSTSFYSSKTGNFWLNSPGCRG